MGRLLFKQPNGKYARWSSIVDAFTLWNATKEEYIEEKIRELKDELEEDFNNGAFERYDLEYILKNYGYSLIRRAILEGNLEEDVYKVLIDMGASKEQIDFIKHTEIEVREDIKEQTEENFK